MKGLAGRSVLVTGGASGIGRATCERLAEVGAGVAVCDRDASGVATVVDAVRKAGAEAVPAVADVSREADVKAAIEAAVSGLGGLHGLVTSAGVFVGPDLQPAAEVSLETFSEVLAVNLTGTFLAAKYALPHLVREGGAIVTIASTAGMRGHGFGAGYTASKGGVIALTRLLAFQYAQQGVRANCICPGLTDTPMAGDVANIPELAGSLLNGIPLRRAAQPEEIGAVACHLLSDDASYTNGQILAVDGGVTAT